MRSYLLGALMVLGSWTSASAQQVDLEFRLGRVTLLADQAALRAILDAWVATGGTRVVGAENLPETPLTLQLVAVPERQALDTLLSGVAGYVATERATDRPDGASMYVRLSILATSVTANTNAPAGARDSDRSASHPAPAMEPTDSPDTATAAGLVRDQFDTAVDLATSDADVLGSLPVNGPRGRRADPGTVPPPLERTPESPVPAAGRVPPRIITAPKPGMLPPTVAPGTPESPVFTTPRLVSPPRR